ncbi:MAG: haloacid dehalogenase-like hydrolase [Alphaproteobacteria bacterium]
MKARGAYTVLVSGGFTFFTTRVAAALDFDVSRGNTLEVEGGKLTGKVIEPILGRDAKRDTLRKIAAQRKIPLKRSTWPSATAPTTCRC